MVKTVLCDCFQGFQGTGALNHLEGERELDSASKSFSYIFSRFNLFVSPRRKRKEFAQHGNCNKGKEQQHFKKNGIATSKAKFLTQAD